MVIVVGTTCAPAFLSTSRQAGDSWTARLGDDGAPHSVRSVRARGRLKRHARRWSMDSGSSSPSAAGNIRGMRDDRGALVAVGTCQSDLDQSGAFEYPADGLGER